MISDIKTQKCSCCPRECFVDRKDSLGFCSSSLDIALATVSLHFGEEPILSGTSGSAAFFFTGCTLRCAFCQNWQISRSHLGRLISIQELSNLFLLAQVKGAHNINLVSATQYFAAITQALELAYAEGLSIPVMWNSGGYESIDIIQKLKQAGVSIFLPDLKFINPTLAKHYTLADNYPEVATKAITSMIENLPLKFDQEGLLQQGVIIRHLILPGHLEDTKKVLEWFAGHAKGKALLSIMTQYTPVIIPNEKRSIPHRFLSQEEHDQVVETLQDLDINDGFFQDLIWQDSWLPNFNNEYNPFQDTLAQTLWHHKGSPI